jgi:hypothetical protein
MSGARIVAPTEVLSGDVQDTQRQADHLPSPHDKRAIVLFCAWSPAMSGAYAEPAVRAPSNSDLSAANLDKYGHPFAHEASRQRHSASLKRVVSNVCCWAYVTKCRAGSSFARWSHALSQARAQTAIVSTLQQYPRHFTDTFARHFTRAHRQTSLECWYQQRPQSPASWFSSSLPSGYICFQRTHFLCCCTIN